MAKTQTLSFPMRLPDGQQAEALRLLDASRPAINQMLMELWPSLDLFAAERTGLAWKQVEKHLVTSESGMGAGRSAVRWSKLDASCARKPPASRCS